MSAALTRTLFCRDHPNRSISKAMMFSNTAMIVDSAAKVRNRKNRALHTNPPGICAKILGSVMKTRLILLSMPAVMGYNVLSMIQPLGEGSTIMDLEDFIVSNNLLPLGSLGYVLFCTRKNGWGWDHFIGEANAGTGCSFPKGLKNYAAYGIPIIIVVIYLKGYYDMFAQKGPVMLAGWMTAAVVFLLFVFYCAVGKRKR